MVNDIIWRAMQRAKIPAAKEPPGLLRSDNKRPDGVTLIPWKKVNVLHGMWQCLTPMRNHICQHTIATNVGHAADKSKIPEHLADPSVHTDCNRNSWRMKQPSKRIHHRTWETYHHCHRENKRDKLYLSGSLSGNSERQHAVFYWVFHHRHGLNTKNNSYDINNINN